jgi:hypothetical protein
MSHHLQSITVTVDNYNYETNRRVTKNIHIKAGQLYCLELSQLSGESIIYGEVTNIYEYYEDIMVEFNNNYTVYATSIRNELDAIDFQTQIINDVLSGKASNIYESIQQNTKTYEHEQWSKLIQDIQGVMEMELNAGYWEHDKDIELAIYDKFFTVSNPYAVKKSWMDLI